MSYRNRHSCIITEAKDLPRDDRPCHLCGSGDWKGETEPAYVPVIVDRRVIDFRLVHSACLYQAYPRSAFSGGRGWKQDRVPTMYTTEGYQEQGGVFTPYATGDVIPSAWGNDVRVAPSPKRETVAPPKQEQLDLLDHAA